MAPADELASILSWAAGDLAHGCGLWALRQTEKGGPGREFGILSVPAPTWADQLREASLTLYRWEGRLKGTVMTRDVVTGFYTTTFLRAFSSYYAPRNAGNDPNDLNRNHADNLVAFHVKAMQALRTAWMNLAT